MADSIPGDTSTSQVLGLGESFSSELDQEGDTDWYNVFLQHGFAYQFWMEGTSTGNGSLIDPYLQLFDPNGQSLLIDDDSGTGLDAYLDYAPAETGNYYISAQGADYTSTGTYRIRLVQDELEGVATGASALYESTASGSVGFASDVADWRSIHLFAGVTYLFDVIGSGGDGTGHQTLVNPWLGLHDANGFLIGQDDNAGVGDNARMLFTATESGTYFLDVQASGQDGSGTYLLSVNASPVELALPVEGFAGGTIAFDGDVDLYSVTLQAGAAYNVALDCVSLVNPYVELLSATGETIASNDNGAGAGLNARLAFTPTVTGTYYIAARASGHAGTGTYSISLTGNGTPGDYLEPNNSIATAFALGAPANTTVYTGLSIGTADQDYFRLTLDHTGLADDLVLVDFLHAQGDIDVDLYAAETTTLVAHSASVGNQESISLQGLPAGDYIVRVFGYLGATNPHYDLTFQPGSGHGTGGADAREDDDSAAAATNVDVVSDSWMDARLSIEHNDDDWFRFSLGATGREGDAVHLSFAHALGDVDMALLAADGTTVLATSSGIDDDERISLAGRAAGDYYVRVYGYNGAANPDYTIGIEVAPQAPLQDRFEPNDTHLQATSLGVVVGTRTETQLSAEAGDADWFTFTLTDTARAGDHVAIEFNQLLGDLDMALFDFATQQLVGVANTASSREQINLAGLGSGVYALVVGGLNGVTNPDYTLTVAVAAPSITPDRFEQNDGAATATNLGTAGGTRSEASLTMEAGDDDWYKFTLGQSGRTGDSFSIAYNQLQGDLDLELYEATGNNILFRSYNSSGADAISLAGLAAGTYLARVFGYSGASNPYYSLNLTAATPIVADRYEDNDSAATALDLRTIINTVTKRNLSMEANDADWFKFSLAGHGQSGDDITVSFTHGQGDIDIQVWNAAGTTVLASSTSVGNTEQISLASFAAGDYLLKVYGYQGASNPTYQLELDVAPAVVPADSYENNDTPATATNLRTVTEPVFLSDLTVQSNDEDWYRFTIGNRGIAGEGVVVAFDGANGDVDIALYNSAGTTMLRNSNGRGDSEQVSFEGLAAGEYLLKVYGSGNNSNGNYAMLLNAAPPRPAPDRFEDNDRADVFGRTYLNHVNGDASWTGLNIQPGDDDYYSFVLDDTGRPTDRVRIDFQNARGDLDLFLYDLDGGLLARSESTSDFEQISLAGRSGQFVVRVAGYNGAQNPDYTLKISGPEAIRDDWWEGNNTRETATQLRMDVENLYGATLTAFDTDYYEFVLAQPGRPTDRISVNADRAGVKVRLLDGDGNLSREVLTDAFGHAQISLSGTAPGHWYAQVDTGVGMPGARYDLEVKAEGATKKNGWTVMVFINGDNNLEGAAIDDINEMEASLNRAGVDVVIGVDRIPGHDTTNGPFTDTRGGYISHDTDTANIGSLLDSWGEWDMGDPANLTAFINWAALEAPAEHYMLIVWDHGGGPLSGVSFDDTNKASGGLSLSEIRSAIESSNVQLFDIVGFDACLMSSVEMAAELDEVADYMVGSELTEPGDGWDYTAILDYLRSTTTADGLVSKIVSSYVNFYGGDQHLAAVALSQIAALEDSLDAFVTHMETAGGSDWKAVTVARSYSKESDWNNAYVDLSSFMSQVRQRSSNATLDALAQDVIDDLNAAVTDNGGPARLNGMTIVLPRRGKSLDDVYKAENYDLLADTKWDAFVDKFLSVVVPSDGSFDAGDPDFAESLALDGRSLPSGNDDRETAYDLGTPNSADFAVKRLSLDSTEDSDWFTFTTPSGAGFAPSLSVLVGNVAGVRAQLLALDGTPVAEATSTGIDQALAFGGLAAGAAYLVNLSATDAALQLPEYELHIDAFGTAAPVVLPDFAEAAGGNNAMAKAWQLGDALDLAALGGVANLSLDAVDLAGGASGGDWFRVDSSRVTEANANVVEVRDVSNGAESLVLHVYDLQGNLLAQSEAPGHLSVGFDLHVEDVLVQVQSAAGVAVRSYTLAPRNDSTAPAIQAPSVAQATGAINATLNAGDTITIALAFDEAVLVGGAPSVALSIGTGTAQATYVSGSGTDTLLFNYTIAAGDNDASGVSLPANGLSLNGGTITDAAGNAASPAYLAVADNPAYKVDTEAPTITVFDPLNGATSVTGSTAITIFYNETVQLGSGTVVLKVLGGPVVEIFTAGAGSNMQAGTNSIVLDPTVDLAAGTTYQLVMDPGVLADLAGNWAQPPSSYTFTTFLAGQTFNGSAGANAVAGTPGNDTVLALGGDDTITGGLGDDTIDGGDGRDYAAYSGPRAGYTVTRLGEFNAVVSGPEGTDSLTNVERLQFSDVFVALDITGNGGQAYRLYKAALDRAPDIGGLGFQINVLDIGFGITDIAANFIESPEFQARYGSLSNAQFVNQLYLNVLDRPADQGGLDFHVNNLDLGLPRNYLLVQFSESGENQVNVIGDIGNGMSYTLG